jgi:hypothetical protein
MATFAIQKANFAFGPRTIWKYPEAASQSFKQGEMVYLASGKVTICADNAVVILGMANQDASGTTDTSIEVILACDTTAFEMTVWEDGGGTNDTIAVTDIGVKYAYEAVGNVGCINTSDTSNDALAIVGFKDAVGDIYPRVYVVVLPVAQQIGAAGT